MTDSNTPTVSKQDTKTSEIEYIASRLTSVMETYKKLRLNSAK